MCEPVAERRRALSLTLPCGRGMFSAPGTAAGRRHTGCAGVAAIALMPCLRTKQRRGAGSLHDVFSGPLCAGEWKLFRQRRPGMFQTERERKRMPCLGSLSGEVLAKRLLDVEKSASEDVSTTFSGEKFIPGNGEKEREKGVQDAKKGGRISFPLLQRVPDSEHGGRHGMTAFFMSAARLPEGSPVRKKKSGNGLAPFPPSSPRRTKGYFQLSMLQCFTRSRSSAALPSLKRSRVPTR